MKLLCSRPRLSVYSLTLSCALLVILCHVANWAGGKWHSFSPREWTQKEVILEIGRTKYRLLNVPTRIHPARNGPTDYASQWLRNMGHTLHYLTGRVPDWTFSGERQPLHWLFLREEVPYQFSETVEALKDNYRREIAKLSAYLKSHGVVLVVLPVPTKMSIETGHLPRSLPQPSTVETLFRPQGSASPDAAYRFFVEAAPDITVDLMSIYRKYREQHPGEHLYVPGDTHWSSLGIAHAAEGIVRNLRQRGWNLAEPRIEYENKTVPSYGHDLIEALQLPSIFLESWEPFRWFEPNYYIGPLTDQIAEKKIYLAGSCYSQRFPSPNQSLGAVLSRAINRLYADSSRRNASATGPLQEMINAQWVLSSGDLLVWEFPMRNPPKANESFPLPLVQ